MHASGLWLLYMPDGGVFAPFSLECLCRLLLAFCMYILAVMLRSEDFLCGIYICPSYTFVLVHFSLYSLVLEGVLCFICSSFALLCIRFIEAAQWHFLYHGSVFFLIKKTTFCLCKKKKKCFRKLAQDDHIWRAGSLALKCKVKHTFLC